MLRLAQEDGTRVLCATPHAHGPTYDVTLEAGRLAHAALVVAAREAGLTIDLRLAAETWYRPDLARLAREGRLVTYASSGRRYALVEFPPTHVPAEAAETLFELRLEGVTPVIAHPERNPSFWAHPEEAVRLRSQGALLQITAGSLTGLFRRESRTCAKALARAGAIDLLASDCHRSDRRPPGLSEAVGVLRRWAGHEATERATVGVPQALLDGRPAPEGS